MFRKKNHSTVSQGASRAYERQTPSECPVRKKMAGGERPPSLDEPCARRAPGHVRGPGSLMEPGRRRKSTPSPYLEHRRQPRRHAARIR